MLCKQIVALITNRQRTGDFIVSTSRLQLETTLFFHDDNRQAFFHSPIAFLFAFLSFRRFNNSARSFVRTIVVALPAIMGAENRRNHVTGRHIAVIGE